VARSSGSNREIAEELHLAEKTIKNDVSSILSKLKSLALPRRPLYLARHTATPGAQG
jgi:FixJ family two-component response regulator